MEGGAGVVAMWMWVGMLAWIPTLWGQLVFIALVVGMGRALAKPLKALAWPSPGRRNGVFAGAAVGFSTLLGGTYWVVYFRLTSHHLLLSSALFATGNTMLFMFATLMSSNPSGPSAATEDADGLLCTVCHEVAPLRSKHCDICGVCVARHDHHCFWTNSCIGKGNHRMFYVFVWAVAITYALFVALACLYVTSPEHAPELDAPHKSQSSYVERHQDHRLEWAPFPLLDWIAITHAVFPWTFWLLVHCALSFPLVLVLLARQTRLIAANLTTSEYYRAHKVHYLSRIDGTFTNPHDSGLRTNIRNFARNRL